MPSSSKIVASALVLASSLGCHAFVVPGKSSMPLRSTESAFLVAKNKPLSNPLFMDPSSGIDFADSISNAWASYNVALEEDPLITK